jgi:hypothetical protein
MDGVCRGYTPIAGFPPFISTRVGVAVARDRVSPVHRQDRSTQPLPEDAQQRCRGLLVQSQHTAVGDVWVEHDDSVLLGHQQIGEASCGVSLAGGHDHAAVAARTIGGHLVEQVHAAMLWTR